MPSKVGAGVHPVPPRYRVSRGCMQQTLVDDDSKLIGNRRDSHNSRCVTSNMSANALDAANARTQLPPVERLNTSTGGHIRSPD